MKRAIITATLISSAAIAADIVADISIKITVPSAAVADAKAYLDTQKLYATTNVVRVVTNPDTGQAQTNSVAVRVLVPETYAEKLQRLSEEAAKRQIRDGVRAVRQERAQAVADAVVSDAPDPVE